VRRDTPKRVSPHCFEKRHGHKIEKIQNHSRRKIMNIKKLATKIGIVVVVLTVLFSALGIGEGIYLSSNGQRGWSLGAAVYNALGWGAEAYRADMAQHGQHRIAAKEGVNAAGNTNSQYGFGGRHASGNFNGARSGHGGGFFLVAVVGVAGYLFYRQRKQKQTAATAA
jgi:hypothetical protein